MNLFEAEVLTLPDDKSDLFCTTKAVAISYNNNAVLCCAEKLRIVNLVVSPHVRDKSQIFMTVVEETPNVAALDKFSIPSGLLNLKATVKQLNEEERQNLMTDPSLTEEFIFPHETLSCFKQAVCSPMNQFKRPQTLIAAVTHDHRVLVFVKKVEGWEMAADCSQALKEHTILGKRLPLILGRDMSFCQYKDFVFSMCTVELEWSTVFPLDSEGNASGQLLFTGTRRGDIHVWMVELPFQDKDNLKFQCTDLYPSEVTAMSWLSLEKNKGMLAAGYLDGSVRGMECTVSYNSSSPTVTMRQVYKTSETDELSISDLSWAVIDQDMTALVVCKQYYLSLYALSQGTVQFISHTHVDVELPLTCLSTFGPHGVVSSSNGSILSFLCKRQSGEVWLDISKANIACLPGDAKMAWLCHGVALSPTSGLCLSAHRANNNYRLPEIRMKYFGRQQIIISNPCTLTIESILQVHSQKDQPVSPQHTMISVRHHIQQLIQNGASCQDIKQFSHNIINTKQDTFSLQLARDVLLNLRQWCAIKVEFQQELEQVNQSLQEISHKVMISHIEPILSQLPATLTLTEKQILNSMLGWISDRQAHSSFSNKLDFESLKKKCETVAAVPCAICGSGLHVTESLQARCTKGHQIKLCSLTLLPCQAKSARKCESCQHPALALAEVSGVDMIPVKSLCTMCGGFLREWLI